MLGYADSMGLWVRRNDPDKWHAFWNDVAFMREIVEDSDNWEVLFAGVFSEIVGIARELTLPDLKREVSWFSADATPDSIGGINWQKRQFFAPDPSEYILPLCPPNRSQGHISEVEFVVEVLRTVLRSENSRSLVVCGLTDNMCSDSWIIAGKAKSGVALNLARTFYKWLLRQNFRLFSFYVRSEHNVSADFFTPF